MNAVPGHFVLGSDRLAPWSQAVANEPGPAAAPNAATFADDPPDLAACLTQWWVRLSPQPSQLIVLAEPGSALHQASANLHGQTTVHCLQAHELGLHRPALSVSSLEASLLTHLTGLPPPAEHSSGLACPPLHRVALVLDMALLLAVPAAQTLASNWVHTAERLCGSALQGLLCVYPRSQLGDASLLAGLQAHPIVAAADGCHDNPFHLPSDVATSRSLRPRINHWLGRISPGLTPARFLQASQGAQLLAWPAGGAVPASPTPSSPAPRHDADARWHIRCLGGLRVQRADGQAISWQAVGSASRKVRSLFALLLLRGKQGANATELINLLWPEAAGTPQGRNRLHHSMNALRAALLPTGFGTVPKAHAHPHVLRVDERYVLTPPAGSWLDIEQFEQLCRQGSAQLREGAFQQALNSLDAALALYHGDLLDDLPAELTDSADPDWCRSRRQWLREMLFAAHRDAACAHRQLGQWVQAQQHGQAALQRDPACAMAHSELMRVMAAQGRSRDLSQQYRQYRQALADVGRHSVDSSVRELYQNLKSRLRPSAADQAMDGAISGP